MTMTTTQRPQQQQQQQANATGVSFNDAADAKYHHDHHHETLDVDLLQSSCYTIHNSGVNGTYEWRIRQIQILYKMICECRSIFIDALSKDLGRRIRRSSSDYCSSTTRITESICAELIPIELECQLFINKLHIWMKPVTSVSTPLLMFPAKSWIDNSKPLAPPAVLIIGPSNYPLQLCLKPLVGALAGGNPCIIKPSELTPYTAQAIYNCIEKYFHNNDDEPGAVQVILGGARQTQTLLSKSWSKVFFTGSPYVGKLVAKSCAETLTPCILECGGKSCCIVDENVPCTQLSNVADRIVFAKFFNTGQTCVAPDTLFVHISHIDKLQQALIDSIQTQYGMDPKQGELGCLVSSKNAQRLIDMIKEEEAAVEKQKIMNQSISPSTAKLFNGDNNNNNNNESPTTTTTTPNTTKILFGGSKECNANERYVAPTLILNPSLSGRFMKEEIFGPILPIIIFTTRDECISKIQQQFNQNVGIPLFLYVFTTCHTIFTLYTNKCRSSGAVRNDALIQLANQQQPLGGLGMSGYGNYYGKYSFDAFTHTYPVTYRTLGNIWDFNNLRCHPHAGNSSNGRGIKAKLLEDYLLYLPCVPAILTPSRIAILSVLLIIVFPILLVYKSALKELLMPYTSTIVSSPTVRTLRLSLALMLENMATWLRQ